MSVMAGENGVIYGIYKAGDQTWFIDEGDAAKLNDAGWCSLFIKAVADGIEAGI